MNSEVNENMNINKIIERGQYELILHQSLEDIHAEGWLLRHKKSGARVMLIPAEDDNKVFNIAFRTPPYDSTGVAHIVEHTVLCGSREFPVKDPFVELVKGSFNTFLNAMTYPDKTMYPVASTNDADFRNLMHVYLDAVFYPNIYREEKIFRQEGWHYELEGKDEPLHYNGVVYNEMKGAFSSADDYLERMTFNALFPDTEYGVESGGDPRNIPDLTYEQYLDFHSKYYHPSNSYIYLYGDMDMDETLMWIDDHYLNNFEQIRVSSKIHFQEPFAEMKVVHDHYPISDEEPEDQNTYLSWNLVMGDPQNVREIIALSVLDTVLFSTAGTPVRQALLDAGIGRDISGGLSDGILQPFYSVIAKNAEEKDADRMIEVIRNTLLAEVEKGIDKKSLLAALNFMEFQFREADYGGYPKGLMYGLVVFDTWLYDDGNPFSSLRQLDAFKWLREQIGTGYFENIVREKFLDNPHSAMVILVPAKGLARERELMTEKKLAAYKASLSEEEIERLIEETKELKEYQKSKDTPEDLECLPMLSRSDIRKEARRFSNIERRLYEDSAPGPKNPKIIFHRTETNGIGYAELRWSIRKVPLEKLSLVALLRNCLGMVDTAEHGYLDLINEIRIKTGGISFDIDFVDSLEEKGSFDIALVARTKAVYEELPFAFDRIREIITSSDFSDEKRIREIIDSRKLTLQMIMQQAGNAVASFRASMSYSKTAVCYDACSGINFYRYIKDLSDNYDEKSAELCRDLAEMAGLLFDPNNLIVSYTSADEGWDALKKSLPAVLDSLDTVCPWTEDADVKPVGPFREAFTTAGQVQFVAQAGEFTGIGFTYNGAAAILRQILSFGYLWDNIRVIGGAYGCAGILRRTGDAAFTSYRDPNLKRTLDIYASVPEYLANFDANEKEMTKYIIGTISAIDMPLTPSLFGSMSMRNYLSGLTYEESQKVRDEILGATSEDIRKTADAVQEALRSGAVCVIGSETAVLSEKDLFDKVEPLI